MPLGAIFTFLAVVMANLPAVQLSPVPLGMRGHWCGPCSAIRNMYHIPIQESVNYRKASTMRGSKSGIEGAEAAPEEAAERSGVQSVGIATTILKALAAAGGVLALKHLADRKSV